MKMSKRIFKAAITLFVMSAALFSGALWPSVQGATGVSPKGNAAAAIRISITITIGGQVRGAGVLEYVRSVSAHPRQLQRSEVLMLSLARLLMGSCNLPCWIRRRKKGGRYLLIRTSH